MSYIKKLAGGEKFAGMRRRHNKEYTKEPMRLMNFDNLKIFVILSSLAFSGIFHIEPTIAGTYLNSAHGNSSYGVKRSASGFPTDYTKGLCGHCHEQHASIDGSEPEPMGGSPSNYELFYSNYENQTDNICFQCHTGVSSYQTGGLVNRSYSYRAGGWTSDSLNDLLEAFSFTSPGTSHYLDDITTLITAKSWNYTSDSNPCDACHNPHAAQGDPVGSPNSAKSSGTRGWPVSRPSQHSKDNNAWGLWGDNSGEKMSDYTTGYQAPYRYYTTSPTYLEPQGDPIANPTSAAQNTTDYVTFCTDCHNTTNTIYSTPLGRNLYSIDWSLEKHGRGAATNDSFIDVQSPYQDSSMGNYVLACTDCHEPHGASNRYLIRKGVNGGTTATTVTVIDTPDNAKEWKSLCSKCHNEIALAHHTISVTLGSCSYCHEPGASDFRNCLVCHYHGNSVIPGVPDEELPDYNWNEKLF